MKLLLKCLFILAFVVLVVLGVQYADEYSKDEDLKRVNDTILLKESILKILNI